MNVEDAEKLIIRYVRQPDSEGYASYGYDVYLPNVIRQHLGHNQPNEDQRIRQLSTVFYDGAWELCRRGILRPGVRAHGLQATDDGNAGNGYSITPFGRQWAEEAENDDFVPTEPQRFGQMLKPFAARFGPSFAERAQEAIRCYGAHAYLACCAMCGAAAEAILLSAAIAKNGEEATLNAYAGASGRSRVQTALLGQANAFLRQEFNSLSVLLKYWRDSAAHGDAVSIKDNEAYTSLALLLRLAQFVDTEWDSLTAVANPT
jgi:hypothetical protein